MRSTRSARGTGELASASHYLDLKSLIDLTCRALAKHIQGKNPEEIRETFNLPDDLTEEEKVAPIEFGMEVSAPLPDSPTSP